MRAQTSISAAEFCYHEQIKVRKQYRLQIMQHNAIGKFDSDTGFTAEAYAQFPRIYQLSESVSHFLLT
jgi:hypothetical protein